MWAAIAAIAASAIEYVSGRKEAARTRDFQKGLSDTAHQREVRDLRAAGLNPILSAGGKGASSPTSQPAAGIQGLEALSSAFGVQRTSAETQNLEKTNANITANTAKTVTDTDLSAQTVNNKRVEEQLTRIKTAKEILSIPGAQNKQRAAIEIQKALKVLDDIQSASGAIGSGYKKLLNNIDKMLNKPKRKTPKKKSKPKSKGMPKHPDPKVQKRRDDFMRNRSTVQ